MGKQKKHQIPSAVHPVARFGESWQHIWEISMPREGYVQINAYGQVFVFLASCDSLYKKSLIGSIVVFKQ